MGWLKDIGKKTTNVVKNPSSIVKGGIDPLGLTKGLFGGGSLQDMLFGKGPSNPYEAPNIDFLKQPAPTVRTDYTNQFKGYKDFYNPKSFEEYVGTVNAPSSVDEVRGQMNQEQLDLLLGNIERDTRQRFGQGLIDSFGKGLFDPTTGADSDIARVMQGQIAAEGGRTAAGARLNYSLADLERLAQREAAQRKAYEQRYLNESNAAEGDRAAYLSLLGLGANADQLNAQLEANRRAEYARLLSGQAGDKARSYNPGDYGLIGNFLNNAASSAGNAAGQYYLPVPA